MNSISFIGNLARDSSLKEAGSSQVLEFTMANNVGFGDRESTNWFNCALWGKRGASLADHLKKGTRLFITGELCIREYTKDDEKRYSFDVKVSEFDFIGEKQGGQSAPAPSQPSSPPASGKEGEDLPF